MEAVDGIHQTGSCTPLWKLWVKYIRQVHVLLLFMRAERTGNCDVHLYALSEIIPILHIAAHLAYAKSARLYLDTIKKLPEIMTAEQFRTFTEGKISFGLETLWTTQLNRFS